MKNDIYPFARTGGFGAFLDVGWKDLEDSIDPVALDPPAGPAYWDYDGFNYDAPPELALLQGFVIGALVAGAIAFIILDAML